ncbi:MAG: hypothetical protein M3R03_03530 [Pseudomonadota bacterium]|nr:hypothetical protein [Pseudomonadota bacterium]
MPAKLKVFRTVTGFHDAYVAAPSRAAALRAWGATTDLFAMDAAEQVTDPKLMAEALARPGEVIKLSRGSDIEHMAAASPAAKPRPKVSPAREAKPRPNRAKLGKAEKRLEEADAAHAEHMHALATEKEALRKREDAARRAYIAKRSKIEDSRRAEEDAYDKALEVAI